MILDDLRSEIATLGEKVKSLKSATPPDKDAIASAVKDLLDAKKKFADNNNGIGVDGKKHDEPMSKAEKKAKAKAAKAGGGGGGDATTTTKQSGDPDSKSAQKKAAKKAEAKAKKAAAKKAGGGKVEGKVEGKGGGKAEPKAGGATAVPAAKAVPITAVPPTKPSVMELKFNPNVPLSSRPVTALTVAVLLDIAIDLKLTSDHKRMIPTLGLPTGEVSGDFAIARYLARSSPSSSSSSVLLGGSTPEQIAQVDQWVDYAISISRLPKSNKLRAVSKTLDRILPSQTYIVGHELTLADIALFTILEFPSQSPDMTHLSQILDKKSPTLRWVKMLSRHPSIREATQLAIGVAQNAEADFGTSLPPLVSGMSYLEGATPHKVCTRFPPEPSGYLHIGHAKAVLLNDYYAKRYKGRLIVRFDDTNPSKEKEEYQSSILEDLKMLQVEPDIVSFTSDYFDTIRGYALKLIEMGKAFMDDTPQEEMQKERMERIESKHRNQSIQECKKLFELLCSGNEEGSKWCLRAKIDMTSDNGTLRDPVLYRQNLTPHHRTNTTYKAYPTYDLACPIVDSVEGVTHALRTTEYNDRDEQYAFLQKTLQLQRRTRIHSFARMNFMYTELSKRKLGWFVEQGYVEGWDDARFPTIRGVMRRGINVAALRNFICSQGASRRVTNMEWNKFWAENKKEIDGIAKRFMAIDKKEYVTLNVTNGPEEEEVYVTTDYLPKDPKFGKRVVRIGKEVILEKGDVEGKVVIGEHIVLMRWGVVEITNIEPNHLEGTFLPNGDFKSAKKKLTWLASTQNNTPCQLTEFDNLISKEKLEEGDDFKDYINPHTVATTEVIGDAGLKTLQKNEIIQLERRGYFRVDRPYVSEEKGIVLFMIPDGKAKPMGGLEGKLAHR